MKKPISKEAIIKKIVDIDVTLRKNRDEEQFLTPKQAALLRIRRDKLERQLYK